MPTDSKKQEDRDKVFDAFEQAHPGLVDLTPGKTVNLCSDERAEL